MDTARQVTPMKPKYIFFILTLSSRSLGPVSCLLWLSGVCPPTDGCTSSHSVTSLENVSQWMQLYTIHFWLQGLENRFLWGARWTVTCYFLESVDGYYFSLEHVGFVPSGSPPSPPHPISDWSDLPCLYVAWPTSYVVSCCFILFHAVAPQCW